jgi:hypothetical protein
LCVYIAVAQSPAHYINSSKGCSSITEFFPLCFLLVHKISLSPLARHCQWCNLVFDLATGLAGLATKLLVLSRSRLSFTQPAKPAKPAKFFCFSFTVHKPPQKGAKYANAYIFFEQCLSWSMDSRLDVRCRSNYDTLSIGCFRHKIVIFQAFKKMFFM